MPRRGETKPKEPIGNPADPQGLYAYLLRYLDWMAVTNYAERTIGNNEGYLRVFLQWCDDRGLERPNEITKPILERYQRYLYHKRKPNGEPLSFRSQYVHIVPVRSYFKWLTKQNYILYNPASELDLPKIEKRLPRYVLTEQEAETVLAQPDIGQPMGLRDRAILETLYSTGIRRMELIGLRELDVDHERGTLMVRQGKNRKDRMIPIGERCLLWIRRYQQELRPQLVVEPDDGTLFLNTVGRPILVGALTGLVRKYVDGANINKRGSCHLFRHTVATLMLENGADIRYIQALLGHAEVSTTQVYTQVSIKQLKKIHTATHPGKLGRNVFVDEPINPDLQSAQDELMAALAAEAQD